MSDLNDLSRPETTDTEPNVLDTLRAHIVRAATWSGWGTTANKVAGLMSATTAAIAGGRSLRLYRRSDDNSTDEEVVSLPSVSVGGSAGSAAQLTTARAINGTSFDGTAPITTAQWGTARNVTIGGTTRSVNGNTNYSWTLADIGAPSTTGTGASGSWAISITGNAATATALATARTINGTNFSGAGNITTAQWGTARTITIGSTGKSVDGGGNVSWSLAELGVPSTTGSGASGSWGISITGNAASASSVAWTGVTGRPTAVSSFSNDAGYITTAAINTANVLAATAGAAGHAVGTYCNAVFFTLTTIPTLGQVVAGADLRGIPGLALISANSTPFSITGVGTTALPGTWRCMSISGPGSGTGGIQGIVYSYLFLRIS